MCCVCGHALSVACIYIFFLGGDGWVLFVSKLLKFGRGVYRSGREFGVVGLEARLSTLGAE